MQTIESPIPGYRHNPAPDRYPTRADWPTPGTHGTLKGRPVKLLEIYFAYYALFKTGPYSVMRADLQDFIPDATQPEERPDHATP